MTDLKASVNTYSKIILKLSINFLVNRVLTTLIHFFETNFFLNRNSIDIIGRIPGTGLISGFLLRFCINLHLQQALTIADATGWFFWGHVMYLSRSGAFAFFSCSLFVVHFSPHRLSFSIRHPASIFVGGVHTSQGDATLFHLSLFRTPESNTAGQPILCVR